MRLEFKDELKREAIDLFFEIKGDTLERDINVLKAEIKWSLILEYSKWGIESFNYELGNALITIQVDTVLENKDVDQTTLVAEIKLVEKAGGYVCRIYEDILKDNKWIEDEYAAFPIELIVDERPASENGDRAQIFVKYLELDITSEPKKLTLTI